MFFSGSSNNAILLTAKTFFLLVSGLISKAASYCRQSIWVFYSWQELELDQYIVCMFVLYYACFIMFYLYCYERFLPLESCQSINAIACRRAKTLLHRVLFLLSDKGLITLYKYLKFVKSFVMKSYSFFHIL